MFDIFDDEYEEDFDGVADGFRPSFEREGMGSHERLQHEDVPDDEALNRSRSAQFAGSPVSPITPAGPSRNSTQKPPNQPNPFASPEDDHAERPLERTPSGNFAPGIARNSFSSISSRQFVRTSAQRFGAGPSHPYGMYPQGIVSRSASTATASTARPARRSVISRGAPQHPYTLYPQGLGDDLDDEDSEQITMAAGFPGHVQSSYRQVGPDGEEQGLVGQFGHTEQLPPYSRYPTEGPEKAPLLAPSMPSALHSRAPVIGSDPGMSLMHAQMLPSAAPQSMTDQSALEREDARSSMLPAAESDSSEDSLLSRPTKSWRQKTWREKAMTRVWRLKVWWIVLAAIISTLCAIVAGIAYHFIMQRIEEGREYNYYADMQSASLWDASLITTPTATAPPTGTFQLAVSTPTEAASECLVNPNQGPAWSCDLTEAAALSIGVTVAWAPGIANASLASLSYNWMSPPLSYGSQASNMQTVNVPLLLVTDNEDPEAGSAFYFQSTYDKLVVVPEDSLSASNQKLRRRNNTDGDADSDDNASNNATQSETVVQVVPAEKPWLCWWNDTVIEVFIYPQQKASYAQDTAVLTSTLMATSTNAATAATTAGSIVPSYLPTDVITTTNTLATGVVPYTGAASGYPAWLSSMDPSYTFVAGKAPSPTLSSETTTTGIPSAATEPAASSSSHNIRKRQYDSINGGPESFYPYMIKIEERRIPGSPPASCTQYPHRPKWAPPTQTPRPPPPPAASCQATSPQTSSPQPTPSPPASCPTPAPPPAIPPGSHQWTQATPSWPEKRPLRPSAAKPLPPAFPA